MLLFKNVKIPEFPQVFLPALVVRDAQKTAVQN